MEGRFNRVEEKTKMKHFDLFEKMCVYENMQERRMIYEPGFTFMLYHNISFTTIIITITVWFAHKSWCRSEDVKQVSFCRYYTPYGYVLQ